MGYSLPSPLVSDLMRARLGTSTFEFFRRVMKSDSSSLSVNNGP